MPRSFKKANGFCILQNCEFVSISISISSYPTRWIDLWACSPPKGGGKKVCSFRSHSQLCRVQEEGGKLFVGQEENRGRRRFLSEVGGKGRRREIIFLLLVCRVEKEATYLFGGSRLRRDESL